MGLGQTAAMPSRWCRSALARACWASWGVRLDIVPPWIYFPLGKYVLDGLNTMMGKRQSTGSEALGAGAGGPWDSALPCGTVAGALRGTGPGGFDKDVVVLPDGGAEVVGSPGSGQLAWCCSGRRLSGWTHSRTLPGRVVPASSRSCRKN